jgi:hypothetical protein
VLGASSSVLIYLLVGRWITPALLYWIGWTLGIGAAESLSGDGLIPVFVDHSRELILRLHVGAAAGFVLGALLYAVVCEVSRTGSGPWMPERADRLYLSSRVVGGAIILQFSLGVVSLAVRLREIGGVSGLATLVDIRQSYLRSAYMVETLPPLVRLASHVEVALSIFPFLFALQDALDRKIRWKRMLIWWVAMIPGGLSTGGRGWIISSVTMYAFSYVVVGGALVHWALVRTWLIRGVAALLLLAGLFSFIEHVRTRDTGSAAFFAASETGRWHDRVVAFKPVLYYLAMPSLAVAAYADIAEAEPRRFGGSLTFPFVAEQLHRIGYLDRNPTFEFFRMAREVAFLSPEPILGFTHSTLVPRMVGDFGRAAYPYVMVGLALLIQLLFLLCLRGGAIARLVAVQLALYGGFWVFQDFMLVMSGAVLPVLWLTLAVLAGQALFAAGLSRDRWIAWNGPEPGESHGAGAPWPGVRATPVGEA